VQFANGVGTGGLKRLARKIFFLKAIECLSSGTPSSKETIKMLNILVKEGFVVRDLFISEFRAPERASVLLERTQ
jgi:hypothetical protein